MNDVAVVLVNYNSGALCASAVRSLEAQRFTGRSGGQGSMQIVVVDNRSPVDQRELLEPLRQRGHQVIFHDQNPGYGQGMNLGMNHVDAEFVLLANPDILVLDGAIAALVDLLRGDPSIGAVGPRGYLDADLFVLLPPNDLPTLWLHVQESLGRVHRGIAARTARARSRRFLGAWRAERPLELAMVSGFAIMLPTALARRIGPFDPHFPFYFEDADLCRRVRRAGYRVLLEPRARMIHFFDQSARSARAEVLKKYDVSRAYYYRKHYGALGAALFRRGNAYAAARMERREGWRFAAVEDLGEVAESPAIAFDRERDYVLEIATDPAFLFCGGHLGRASSVAIPRRTWNALEATQWYVRALDPGDLSVIRYVTFCKTTHSTGPVSYEEFLRG